MIDPELHSPAIKKKRKTLILEAHLCPDYQWDYYKESIYPLLRDFGCFSEF